MHKYRAGFRFIIASKLCSTKKIKIGVTYFQTYSQTENFHKNAKYLSNHNKFWVLRTSNLMTKSLNKVNIKKRTKPIATYDFSTLYTKLPYDKLSSSFDFTFKGNKSYVRILTNGKAFRRKEVKGGAGFSKASLKTAVTFVIEICYFNVGNITVKQMFDNPIIIDPAPFWANIFLYSYEEKYMSYVFPPNKVKARHFYCASVSLTIFVQ